MGLLDFAIDPQSSMLTNMGLGLLSAGGPSSRPVSLGQAIGSAGQMGMEGFQQAQQNQMRQMQLGDAQRKQLALKQFREQLPPQMQAMFDVAPEAVLSQMFKEDTPIALADGAKLVRRDGSVIANNQSNKPINGYLVPDGNGGYVPDPKLLETEKQLKQIGATRVQVSPTVKVGQTFGEDVAKSAAGILTSRVEAASHAPQTVMAANQILAAIDTGKVMAGPATKWKITAQQLFGSDPSKLEATRSVIQGLAKLSLQGRQSLKGQGTITDYEGKLLANAESGNIDEMTTDEIKLLVKGAIKNANYIYGLGQKASSELKALPEFGRISTAFDLPEMPKDTNNNQWSATVRKP